MDRRTFLCALGALFSGPFLAAAGCGPNGAKSPGAQGRTAGNETLTEGQTMDFNAVELGDHSENPCTPKIAEDFDGIRINVPERVVVGEDQFAVCGTYLFSAEYVYSLPDIHRAVVLVAVDAERHTPFACNILRPFSPDPRDEAPPVPEDPEWMSEHRIQKFFNVDLLDYMDRLPERSATYYVYALIEGNVSNVCKVRVEM